MEHSRPPIRPGTPVIVTPERIQARTWRGVLIRWFGETCTVRPIMGPGWSREPLEVPVACVRPALEAVSIAGDGDKPPGEAQHVTLNDVRAWLAGRRGDA